MAKDKKKPTVHKDLDGLNIKIDSFGELSTNMDIDKINEFLNKKVVDRKLEDQNGKFSKKG